MKGINEDMSFLEHLEELRWHLIRSIVVIVIASIVAFIFKEIVFDKIILYPKTPEFPTNQWLCKLGEALNIYKLCINTKSLDLQNIYMAGQFLSHIKISMISGLIVAFPYILYELWRFIGPALYQNERKHARGAVLTTSFLFLSGILFGYFIISPLSIHFLGTYKVSEQVLNDIALMSYVSIVASISLASGILFELPILVYFLSKIGIVTPQFLKKYRRHAIVIVLIIAAIITPPDVFSQILVSFPLLFLYELSIIISKRVYKNKKDELIG